MPALSSRESSKVLVLLVLVASLGAGCGGGGSRYPDPVAGTGGSVVSSGGTGITGTGGNPGTGGAVGTGGSTPGGAVPIANYGTAIIAALCASSARCGFVSDVASCTTTNRVGEGILTLQADVAAGRVDYNATQAGLCIDAVRDSPCTTSAVVVLNALPDPCAGVFAGKVAVGGTCYVEGECAGTGACYNLDAACAMACCPGTCVAPVTTGGNCASASCPAGNYCRVEFLPDGTPTSFTCTPRATAEGSVCDDGDGCQAPLFCTPNATTGTTGTGTCGRSLPATGARCIQNAGCDDAHDYCNPSGVCTNLVGVGSACSVNATTGRDNCVRYAYCTAAGVCKAYGASGAVCITNAAGTVNDCQGDQTCPTTTRTCTAPPAAMSCR